MCGIVGIISDSVTFKLRKIFKEMLFYDTVRGVHSTGIIRVNKNLEVDHYKKALQASDFLQLAYPKEMIDEIDSKVLIGHNRAATKGKVNHENAHPFQHGKITGVHNGTLRQTWNLDQHTKFDVDSEMIINHLNQNSIQETIKVLKGAFALVWYDSEAGKVYMVRNDERPLWFCTTKDDKSFLFASEPWMMRVPCARHSIDITTPQEVKPGVLFSIDVANFPSKESVEAAEVELGPKEYGGTSGSSNRGQSNITPVNKNSGKTEGDRLQAANQALKNKSTKATSIVKGDTRAVKVTGFRRVPKKNDNDFNYVVDGTDTTGMPCVVYISETQYKQIVSNRDVLIKVCAAYMCSAYSSNFNGGDKYYVLDGRESLRMVYEDYISTMKGDDLEPPFNPDPKPDPSSKKDKKNDSKVLSLGNKAVRGYNGRVLTRKKFGEITSCGCANCAETPKLEDADKIKWLSHEAFYCADCKELDLDINM